MRPVALGIRMLAGAITAGCGSAVTYNVADSKSQPTVFDQARAAALVRDRALTVEERKACAAARSTPPKNPVDAILSRQADPRVEIRGDAIVFPLEYETTSSDVVGLMRLAQSRIFDVIENDLDTVERVYPDKATRRAEKPFKRHKKFHLAFAGTCAPTLLEEYEKIKSAQTLEQKKKIKAVFEAFLNTGVSGSVLECKVNSDGHIVVRIDIHPAAALAECREAFSKIFGTTYVRYADPEKQKTLAAVIATVNYEKLSVEAIVQIKNIVSELEKTLKRKGPFPLHTIEWIEYKKRTLSENSRISVREYGDSVYYLYLLLEVSRRRFSLMEDPCGMRDDSSMDALISKHGIVCRFRSDD